MDSPLSLSLSLCVICICICICICIDASMNEYNKLTRLFLGRVSKIGHGYGQHSRFWGPGPHPTHAKVSYDTEAEPVEAERGSVS